MLLNLPDSGSTPSKPVYAQYVTAEIDPWWAYVLRRSKQMEGKCTYSSLEKDFSL
jgi:hypothetical protein